MISNSFLLRFICAGAFTFSTLGGTSVNRLRGVPLNSKFLYKEGKDFTCFDGSLTISFDWVNDDYCDCADGSDEPGTSACPRGSFHCPNLGASAMNIPSSRVNDMICDCCDGSDEWAGHVKCPNLCEELGRRLRAERAQKEAIHREGYATRLKMADEAKKDRQEKQQTLEKLETQLSELSTPLEEAKGKMEEASRVENEAKDVEKAAWDEARRVEREAERKRKAEAAFKDLDANKDNKITVEEIQARLEFDEDSDGIVTVEEATTVLGNSSEVDGDHFVTEVWQRIEFKYKSPTAREDEQENAQEGEEEEGEESHTADASGSYDSSTATKDTESFSKESTEAGEEPEPHAENVLPKPSPDEPTTAPADEGTASAEKKSGEARASHEDDYTWPARDSRYSHSAEDHITFSNETQALMRAADEAREKYQEILDNKSTVEREIRDIKALLSIDFGPDSALLPLYKECFEIKDSQYTYKLCLFDEAFQISLNDGHKISLGRWGKWIPTATARKQLYENGQSCWNGPTRTTTVVMECGSENALKAATEPSMCEYALTFQTPAVCEPPESLHHEHEL